MKVLYVIAFCPFGHGYCCISAGEGNIEQLLDANDVVRSDEQYEDMLAVLQNCGWLL